LSFSSSINLSSLNGSTGFRLDGVAAGDESGYSVASAGDVNGDGYADLIIGASGADANGVNSGASYVVFGKPSSFASGINLGSLDGSTGFRLVGDATNDYSGYSVASAGDVNGDGFADLIVGANYADPNGNGNSGSSYVVFGKSSPFASSINLATLDGTTGFRLNGVAPNDLSGSSVASAGDVNGDGFNDLVIGAYHASPNGTFSGSSYVVFGKASGFGSAIYLSSLDGTIGFRLDGISTSDFSGISAGSAGDVNGDGYADFIIGAPYAHPNSQTNDGSSYVVFGKASSYASAINLASLDGTTGFRLDGRTLDESGISVASAGDVNGDGFADLIVGAYQANGAIGASYVVFGKASSFVSSINLASLDGTIGFRLDGVAAGDTSGCSVAAAGDVNGDGFADLFIGAKLADPNGVNSGASYVVFGKASGFASAINLSSLNGTTGFRLNGVAAADASGSAVASAGDVNGDGRPDLIIGAYQADPNGNSDAGSTYVYFSPASGGATYRGTTLADRLSGTSDGDTINGYSGNDILNGNAGDDTITGGTGNDTIDGGAGNDTVKWAVGDGNDTVTLGTGTNSIDFGANAYTYVDSGAQRVFTIGSASVTVTDWTTGTNSVVSYNQAPSITSGGSASFAENSAGTAYTATGTDPNSDPLTYTLGGVDAARFNINTISGAVTFKAAPNFEAPTDAGANNVYDITVTAFDGSLSSAAQPVAITVTNVNEAPSITSGGSASFAENATGTAYTATGTDPDSGTTLTYALGGVDAARFNLNTSSGAVTFKAAPNFEAPTDAGANNVYDITVTASDGGLTSAARAVAITVTNVNEAPSITSGGSASFAENATGTVYTATGTDPDANTTLSFALGGVDAAWFNIDAASGVVTFQASPDFEAPADAGANNVYDITVTASDGKLKSTAQAVAITVTDVVEFKIGQGNGASTDIKAEPYTGPVPGIEYQVIAGANNDIIIGSDRSDFINAGMGDDAIDGGAGNDVIDGGQGSNFITGGAGRDGFFLDGRAAVASTTWSTLTDFSAGEQVTIWGYKPGVSKFLWVASDGAEGYKGATMHCDLDGNGVIDTSVTFTGLTQAQLPVPSFGTVGGQDYIFFG